MRDHEPRRDMPHGNDKVEISETKHERLWRVVKDQYRVREQAADLLSKIVDGDMPSTESVSQVEKTPNLSEVFIVSIEYLESVRKETQDILSKINEVLYE